jgi:hypothetical protein
MKYLVLLSLVFLNSCASYQYTMKKRQIAYLNCVTHLNDQGLKPEMLERICDKALEK